MPATISAKSLREKRAKVIAEARAKFIDLPAGENREPTAEEQAGFAKLVGGIAPDGTRIEGEEERLKRQIDTLERQERLEADLERPANPLGGTPVADDPDSTTSRKGKKEKRQNAKRLERMRYSALQGWCMFRKRDINAEQEEALKHFKINPNREEIGGLIYPTQDYRKDVRGAFLSGRDLRGNPIDLYGGTELQRMQEQRAGANAPQAVALSVSGGYTIPEGFVNNLEIALLQYGGIRVKSTVMRTISGNDLPWPTVNDTTVKGQRISENTTVPTKDVTFGAIVLHAYKYTSGIVLVPVELMEDSAFNLAATLGELLGIRIGRIQADEFTITGGGAAPVGIVSAATLGQTAASATAIAGDDLYGLKHSVDPAYRSGAGVAWMFHDKILLAIKKLKDGLGRYLWQASLAGSAPDTLDGDPIVINQSMASTIASSNITVLYGRLDKYIIRDVAEIRMRRLVERFADADQEAFLMFMRSDGNLLDAGTRPVKFLQH